MTYPKDLNFDDIDPEHETLAAKIKAIKQILDDPPYSLWPDNYDLLEALCIQWDETGNLTNKQINIIDDAYERYCE